MDLRVFIVNVGRRKRKVAEMLDFIASLVYKRLNLERSYLE